MPDEDGKPGRNYRVRRESQGDDNGRNEGLREEEEADEPEWSGGMVGESVLADMELEARLRGGGEEVAPEAGGR